MTLFALGNTNEGAGKPWDRCERGRCWQLSCSIFQSWLLKQICKFRKLNRWRRYMSIFMHSRGWDCFMQSLLWEVIKLYVICKFTGSCWLQFYILSTHCSWAQIPLLLRSKAEMWYWLFIYWCVQGCLGGSQTGWQIFVAPWARTLPRATGSDWA